MHRLIYTYVTEHWLCWASLSYPHPYPSPPHHECFKVIHNDHKCKHVDIACKLQKRSKLDATGHPILPRNLIRQHSFCLLVEDKLCMCYLKTGILKTITSCDPLMIFLAYSNVGINTQWTITYCRINLIWTSYMRQV